MTRASALALSALLVVAGSARASEVVARRAAVVTGSPQATAAGVAILQSGGNAIDAAVAASLVSGFVTPEKGGLGGGGFLLYREATGGVWILDFRETAPAASARGMFLLLDGSVNPDHARGGALTIGVPGTLIGLEEAHRRFGRTKWAELVAPVIAVARENAIAARSLSAIAEQRTSRTIERFPTTSTKFFGTAASTESSAAFLDKVAARGSAELYSGSTGKKLVELVAKFGGSLSTRDLRLYCPVWRSPVTVAVGNFTVMSAPPPSTSGIGLAQTLQILSGFDLRATGEGSASSLHIFAEAERRAAADRAEYLGDPDQTRIPFREILAPEYLVAKRNTIDAARATVPSAGAGLSPEVDAASHVIASDAEGNVAILSTSLGLIAGSGLWFPEGGFFLNSALSDFTARPDGSSTEGRPAANANAVAPGKRMLSSLAPVILLNGDKPVLAVAAGEGSAVSTVVQILYGVAIYGKTLSAALEAPRVSINRSGSGLLLRGSPPESLLVSLRAMGHLVDPPEQSGGECGLWFTADGIRAVTANASGGAAGGY